MIKVCFVCLGNICRSPTAEGVMQGLVDKRELSDSIQLDSAGTGAWHVGNKADARSREVAQTRGLELTSRARQFKASDFEKFDYVLAMDRSNYENLSAMATSEQQNKLHMFRSFDPATPHGPDVPDPYYGGPQGFEDVFDMCESACEGLLNHIQDKNLKS